MESLKSGIVHNESTEIEFEFNKVTFICIYRQFQNWVLDINFYFGAGYSEHVTLVNPTWDSVLLKLQECVNRAAE